MAPALPPPRGPHPLLPLLLTLGLVAAAGIPRARAETIGFRIELRACAGETCRDVKVPHRLWSAQYACDARAARIAEEAEHLLIPPFGLPAGNVSVRAKCVPVEGIPSA